MLLLNWRVSGGGACTGERQRLDGVVCRSPPQVAEPLSDSPVTMGSSHQQCQLPPHVTKPYGLARDDGRHAPAVLVAATRRGAVQTRLRRWAVPAAATRCGAVRTHPPRWEAHTGNASRGAIGLTRDDGRRAPVVPVAATRRGAVRTHLW
jgi:hypothetical protein